MAGRSLLRFALVVLSGCTGNLIPGVPLEDGGDEYSVDDAAATAVIVEPEAGSAAAVVDAGTVRDAAGSSTPARMEAGAQEPAKELRDAAKPPVEAGSTGTVRNDAAVRSDGSTPPPPPPASGMRDLTADPSKFLGAPRCDKAGALLCDDFESEAIGAGPDSSVWMAPFGNLPKIDTTRAARGTKSLYFELAAGLPGHIEEKKTFPAPGNTVYGRMFVWIDALPTAPAFAHWTLVSALGADNPTEVRLGGQLDPNRDNANYFGLGSDHGESGDWATAGQEPASKARAQAWICLEWLFKGSTNQTQVWIDGVEQKSLNLSATDYRAGDMEAGKRFVQPTFDRLRIGWWLYQSNAQPSPAKLWIDEVIVDDERIGCAL